MSNYIFNDPIHGTMEVDAVLVKLIDTPEFQRLRNIKQLGTSYYVYPGATHNRFEHCIGVSYIAGQVIDKLSLQKDIDITPIDKLCVQLAGLLHDIGHGPFSHLFDDSFIQQNGDSQSCTWSHELQSCRIFDYILQTNNVVAQALKDAGLTDIDMVFIKEMIDTKDYNPSNERWSRKGRPRSKSFLYEIVSNERTGIDVDKFDYLLRDCYHLGVNCILDWRRLVSMMKVIEKDGERVIAIRDKEKDNVFNMFYLRMHLRRIAYQHCTGAAVALMIADIFKICNGVVFPDMLLSESIHHLPKYLTLTDSVLETISNMPHCNQQPDNLAAAKQIIHRINTRRLYTLVGETPPSTTDFKNKERILCEIMGDDTYLREHILFDELKLNFGKWGPTGDPLQCCIFYDKHGDLVPEKLYNQSSLFVPSSWSQKQLRVFCRSEDTLIVEQCRKKCQEWIARNDFEVKT